MSHLAGIRWKRGSARALAVGLALAVSSGCAGEGPTQPGAASGSATADAVTALPLPLGFYVSSDTPCGEASNATLALLHRDGLNGAREFCRFAALDPTGPSTFRAVESCSSIVSGEEWSVTVDWEILGPASFRRKSAEGWVSEFRFCEQPSLPEPWRDNDI